MEINEAAVEEAVLGGAILGGGGGGWVEEGRKLGRIALKKGFKGILRIQDLPEDALLLTVSAVGAPSAGSELLEPEDYVRAVERFIEKTRAKIDGLISSEIGALGVVNGWVQSAALEIPVVDAPCNGRAHPLALMGSMDLHRERNFISHQIAVGGGLKKANRVEDFFEGPLDVVSKNVREAAVRAGGIVAVARNPVPAGYVRKNGAPGAIEKAMRLGKIWLDNKPSGPKKIFRKICDFLGGDYVLRMRVKKISLKTEGGLDIGTVHLKTRTAWYELTFWNEYMTFEREGQRLATFPDLIMTFDFQTLMPLISAQLKEDHEVAVITVPAQQLVLGAGMRDEELLGHIEKAVGKDIVKYRK